MPTDEWQAELDRREALEASMVENMKLRARIATLEGAVWDVQQECARRAFVSGDDDTASYAATALSKLLVVSTPQLSDEGSA